MGIRAWWAYKYKRPKKITLENFWDTDLKDIDKAFGIDRSKMPISMHIGGIRFSVNNHLNKDSL